VCVYEWMCVGEVGDLFAGCYVVSLRMSVVWSIDRAPVVEMDVTMKRCSVVHCLDLLFLRSLRALLVCSRLHSRCRPRPRS